MRIGWLDIDEMDNYDGELSGTVLFPNYSKGGGWHGRPPELRKGGWILHPGEYEMFKVKNRLEEIGEDACKENGFGKLYDEWVVRARDYGSDYSPSLIDGTAQGKRFIEYVADCAGLPEADSVIATRTMEHGTSWSKRLVLDRGPVRDTWTPIRLIKLLPDVSKMDEWAVWDKKAPSIFSINENPLPPIEIQKIDNWSSLKYKIDAIEHSMGTPFYVYGIRLERDGETWWYVGQTSDLQSRISTHKSDKNVLNIEYIEGFDTREGAKEREREMAYEIAIERETTNVLGGR